MSMGLLMLLLMLLMKHGEENNILYPLQHGFRKRIPPHAMLVQKKKKKKKTKTKNKKPKKNQIQYMTH
jgi:hypothetical protein